MTLIVEMEMPKFCIWRDDKNEPHRCPLLNEDDDCVLQDSNIWMGWNEQYAHCPIKGVLPEEHGDLIDRDVLYMAVKSHNTSDAAIARNHNRVTSLQNLSTIRKGYIAEKHICLDDIIRAEAVIKAERKDDGK